MPRRVDNRSPVRALSPLVAALLLAAAIATGHLSPAREAGVDAYIERVVTAINSTPYRIGSWTGTDLAAAPPAAVDLLRPSVILHRAYQHSGRSADGRMGSSQTLRLVIVHCPDVRDMAGHHPPNCYPATGWNAEASERVAVRVFGSDQQVSLDRFAQLDDAGVLRHVTIASAFIVPEAPRTLLPDMQSLKDVAENHRRTLLGAAQLQIIFDSQADSQDVLRALETFTDALRPLVDRITEGTS